MSTSQNFTLALPSESGEKTINLFVRCLNLDAKSADEKASSQQRSAKQQRALLVVHGLGEHSGRYLHLPTYLKDSFDLVYAYDQRGHGRSGGVQGDAPEFKSFLDDLETVARALQQKHPHAQWVILGHSFGGLVVLSFLAERLKNSSIQLRAAILSAPLLKVALTVPRYKKILGEFLGRTLNRLQLSNEINPSYLSHDPKVVAAYIEDKLVHAKITPRMYLSMTAQMNKMSSQSTAQIGAMECPVLFLLAGMDRIVDSNASRAFFDDLKCRDKKCVEYPEMYHEILNEIDKQKVFEDIKLWLNTLS